jgi:hypothetical protein
MMHEPQNHQPQRLEYKTIEERYQTVYPAMVSVLWFRWTGDLFRSLYRSMPGPGWLRGTLAGLAGLVPAVLLFAGWLLLISLTVIWPFAFLQMLPVRIAVGRHAGQYGSIWVMSFFSALTLGILWVVALTVAMRDKPAPQPRAGY